MKKNKKSLKKILTYTYVYCIIYLNKKRKEMIIMKIKEILNLTSEELKEMMTEKEFKKMQDLGLDENTLLDALQDSAKLSGQEEDEEHITIDAYLDYLEDIKNA